MHSGFPEGIVWLLVPIQHRPVKGVENTSLTNCTVHIFVKIHTVHSCNPFSSGKRHWRETAAIVAAASLSPPPLYILSSNGPLEVVTCLLMQHRSMREVGTWSPKSCCSYVA